MLDKMDGLIKDALDLLTVGNQPLVEGAVILCPRCSEWHTVKKLTNVPDALAFSCQGEEVLVSHKGLAVLPVLTKEMYDDFGARTEALFESFEKDLTEKYGVTKQPHIVYILETFFSKPKGKSGKSRQLTKVDREKLAKARKMADEYLTPFPENELGLRNMSVLEATEAVMNAGGAEFGLIPGDEIFLVWDKETGFVTCNEMSWSVEQIVGEVKNGLWEIVEL